MLHLAAQAAHVAAWRPVHVHRRHLDPAVHPETVALFACSSAQSAEETGGLEALGLAQAFLLRGSSGRLAPCAVRALRRAVAEAESTLPVVNSDLCDKPDPSLKSSPRAIWARSVFSPAVRAA
jgi:hypothetical protein